MATRRRLLPVMQHQLLLAKPASASARNGGTPVLMARRLLLEPSPVQLAVQVPRLLPLLLLLQLAPPPQTVRIIICSPVNRMVPCVVCAGFCWGGDGWAWAWRRGALSVHWYPALLRLGA